MAEELDGNFSEIETLGEEILHGLIQFFYDFLDCVEIEDEEELVDVFPLDPYMLSSNDSLLDCIYIMQPNLFIRSLTV